MPAKPSTSLPPTAPIDPAWIGFFVEAGRLAALAQERRKAQLLEAPTAYFAEKETIPGRSQEESRKPKAVKSKKKVLQSAAQ